MGYMERDIQAVHIANPTSNTFTSGSLLLGNTETAKLVADLAALDTSIDAILVALENVGILAKA